MNIMALHRKMILTKTMNDFFCAKKKFLKTSAIIYVVGGIFMSEQCSYPSIRAWDTKSHKMLIPSVISMERNNITVFPDNDPQEQ